MLLGARSVGLIQSLGHPAGQWGGSVRRSNPGRRTLPSLTGERRRQRHCIDVLICLVADSSLASLLSPPPTWRRKQVGCSQPCTVLSYPVLRDSRVPEATAVSSPSTATDAQQANGAGEALLQSVPAVFEFGGCANASATPLRLLARDCVFTMRAFYTYEHSRNVPGHAGQQRVFRCAAFVKWMILIRSRRACGKWCTSMPQKAAHGQNTR